MKKIFLIANIVFFLITAVYVGNHFRTQSSSTPTSVHAKLAPITAEDIHINYPYVRVPLYDPLYKVVVAEEEIASRMHGDDNLFQSKKRISEMLKWGSHIQPQYILTDADLRNSAEQLKKWWSEKEKGWLFKKSELTFNSWESLLARYLSHIDRYVLNAPHTKSEIVSRKLTVLRELGEDRSVLLENLLYMGLKPKDFKYLLAITSNAFDQTVSKYSLDTLNVRERTYPIFYNAESVIPTYTKGQFNIYIDPVQIPLQQGLTLKSSNKLYNAILPSEKDKFIMFKDVEIDTRNPILTLKYQIPDSISLTKFSLRAPKNDQEKPWYIYTYVPDEKLNTYDNLVALTTESSTTNELLVKKQSTYVDEYINQEAPKKELLLSGPISTSNTKLYIKTISNGIEKLQSYVIGVTYNLESPNASQPKLQNDTVTIVPILKPGIFIDSSHLTRIAQPSVEWKGLIGAVALSLLIFNLIMFSVYRTWKNKADIASFISWYVKKHHVFIFNVFVIVLVIDLYFLKDIFVGITYLLLLLWLAFMWGSSMTTQIYLPLASIFLTISLVSSRFSITALGEKSATWAYISLILGLISLATYKEKKSHITFLQFLITREYPLFRPAVAFFAYLLGQIKRFLAWVFVLNPKSPKDHMHNLVVLALIIIVPTITVITFRAVAKVIDRNNQNPVIETVQPTIAYNSNKIVLNGKRFGWNVSKKHPISLMSDAGPLNVSLWTDTQLVVEIPLKVNPGHLQLWIQKPIIWDGEWIPAVSNKVSIKIISRTDGWDTDDDEFFQQMEKLPSTIRSLNGYK